MDGLYMTVDGVVGSDPRRAAWKGEPIISFRFVAQERRYDRTRGRWSDGHASWMTVSCFRELARNVDESVRKGDRLIVHGTVRIKDYVGDDGTVRTGVSLEADGVGHNLAHGTTRFRPSGSLDGSGEQIRARAEDLDPVVVGPRDVGARGVAVGAVIKLQPRAVRGGDIQADLILSVGHLPAGEYDLAVREHRGREVMVGVEADLMHAGAVGVHDMQL